ncbi:MAG: T9SS type A sorting domain-containing protein [Flavobacteriales bacterium]
MRTPLLFAFMISLAVPLGSFAQSTFQKACGSTGNDEAGATVLTNDGAIASAGVTSHPAFWTGDIWVYDADMYLVKTTMEGDDIWKQRIGSPNRAEKATSLAKTADGGFILCGLGTVVSNETEMLLVKTDSLGQVTWAKSAGRPGYDAARQVQQTSDGGYVVAGFHTDTINSGAICILKFDENGDTVWTRIFNSDGVAFDEANSVQQNSDGDYVITGSVSNAVSAGLCFMKLSNNGSLLWAKSFEGGNDGQSICQTQDGGYAILGTHYDPASENGLYLIRTTALGDTVWTRMYGGPEWAYAHCVIESSDGGFVLSGGIGSSAGQAEDAYLLKTDSVGSLIWSWSYGAGWGNDIASSAIEMADGGVVAAGLTYGTGLGSFDFFLLRTDSSGSTGCNEQVVEVLSSVPPVTISDIVFEVTSGFNVDSLSFAATSFGTSAPICLTTATHEANDDSAIFIYPNPASERITISTPGNLGVWSCEILDLNGKVLLQERTSSGPTLSIQVESLDPGSYVVKAIDGHRTYYAKLIVQPGWR